jgi:MFS family permease
MTSLPSVAAPPHAGTSSRAGYALLILTLINLVNYLDRYIVASALPSIQRDLGINNTQSGLLGTVFIVVFMLASPVPPPSSADSLAARSSRRLCR